MGPPQNIAVNLPSRAQTAIESKVLNLDLYLVPVPVYDSLQSYIDLFALIRLLKLQVFSGKPLVITLINLNSNLCFFPNVNDSCLTIFENMMLKDLAALEAACLAKCRFYRQFI